MKTHMKSKIIALFFLLVTSGVLKAQSTGFGAGIVVGEPTGLSGKYWLSQTTALDGAVAWSFLNEGSFYIHADYLFHYFDIISIESGKMPLYWGFGAKVALANEAVLGAQVPLGIAYLFDGAPLDVFLEIRPGFNIAPATQFDMSGGIGVRFYFNE